MAMISRSLLLTSAAVVALSVTPHTAMAAPEGGVVVGGSANISQSGTKTDIHQHSNKAILDWRSFDITSQEHVEFHQPSSSAMTLNRIRDTKPSQIDGKLTANGHVMLINPNGVVFGAESQVDVGSLTATTADIDNDDFMAGNLGFNKAGQLDGAIINRGSITVKEAGLVNLVAPRVENHGVIQAKLGKIQLAAADTFTLDMAGDGLLQVAVTQDQAAKLARNTGRITAEGGTIALTASHARTIVDSLVENTGILEATSMTQIGGKVILGGASVKVSGTINTSGKTGGGEILIGGDYQGKAIDNVETAKVAEIANTATITANATNVGDGGKVIVWADQNTSFAGSIEAKGGTNGGDGGFVETSGKKHLNIDKDAQVQVGALNGTGGEWLLDPEDIVISNSGNDGDPNTSDVATATINTTLNGGGNVTITTAGAGPGNGDITLTGDIDKSVANNDVTLRLNALRNIIMTGGSINSSSGDAVNTIFNADTDADMDGAIALTDATITTLGGSFTAGGGVDPTTTAAYGNATYNYGVDLSNADIDTAIGAIRIHGHGLDGSATDEMVGLYIRGGSVIQTTDGDIALSGEGGSGTGNDNHGAVIGNDGTNNLIYTNGSGDITLNATAGTSASGGSGLYMRLNGRIDTYGSGDIMITGTGAGTSANDQNGILLFGQAVGGADVHASGSGNVTLIGNANTTGGTGHRGVYIGQRGNAEVNTGNMTVTGTVGAGSGLGVNLYNETHISSSGTGGSVGTVQVTGTGGATGSNNYGIEISAIGSTSYISTVDGDLMVTGNGGGTVDDNYGVFVNGANRSIETTGTGSVAVTGTSTGTGNDNYGIYMAGGSSISSSLSAADAGTITLNGTGGDGDDSNLGVYLSGSSSELNTVNGDITITGRSNGTGTNNHGVYLYSDVDVETTGSADITLTGTAGTGGSDIKSETGTIVLGEGAQAGTASGHITLNANTLDLADISIGTTGTVKIAPRTDGTSIGLGGGVGTLHLTDAELALIDAGSLIIGDAARSNITSSMTSWDLTGTTYDVDVIVDDMNVQGLTLGAGDVTINSATDIIINNAIDNSGAGGDVYLVAGNDFINNAGAGALNPGAGRYLVYIDSPDSLTAGGLNAQSVFNTAFPSVVTAGGNRFVFVSAEPAVSNIAELPSTVEYQMQNPDYWSGVNVGYTISYADNKSVSNAQSSPNDQTTQKPRLKIRRTGQNMDTSSENDASVRLVEANLMKIEQPIIDSYDLCSYSIKYCQ